MGAVRRKGIIRGGQVVVEEPIDLPDGSEVTILAGALEEFLDGEEGGLPQTATAREEMGRFAGIEFMTEDEQGGNPEAVRQWIEDLRSIPPVPENAEKEAEWRTWVEAMRRFNIEAVRRQFEEGTS
jgi:hypothetical protein